MPTELKRAHNFNAGPSGLPLSVLQQAQAELLDFQGTGMSVMEISHRSKEFEAVIQAAEADLRELMNIPAKLQGLVPAGRGQPAICHDPDEHSATQANPPITLSPAPGAKPPSKKPKNSGRQNPRPAPRLDNLTTSRLRPT